MRIREFEAGDLNSILDLANAHAFFDGPTNERDFEVSKKFPPGFLVAIVNDRIVGFIQTTLKEVPEEILKNWEARSVANIDLLVVDPDYRGRGIAGTLLEEAISNLEQAGVDMIMLHCPVTAKTAKHLYERMGFTTSAYHMRRRSTESS